MKRLLLRPGTLVGLLALFGCGAITGLYMVEQPSSLALAGNGSTITAPDTVARNVAFDVKFTSYENKCTDSPREDVLVAGDSISIHSFVRRSTLGCGDALLVLPHTAQVRVAAPGIYHIHVHGQRPGAAGEVVLSRDIVVR